MLGAVRRRELLEWAQQGAASTRRYIIEDDYDSEFRLRGRPIPPLRSQDTHESVIYLNTFTRSLGSVFRIAYLVLPPHLFLSFNARFATRSCMVGALEQLELARFITSGDYERHVNRQRTIYRRLQDTLVAQLSAGSARLFLSFKGVGAGLHFLMTVDSIAPSQTIESAALERGIRLVNIENYRFERMSSSIQNSPIGAQYDQAHEQHPDQISAQDQKPKKPAGKLHTYVMNVSGLDGDRADKIAAALSDAILTATESLHH